VQNSPQQSHGAPESSFPPSQTPIDVRGRSQFEDHERPMTVGAPGHDPDKPDIVGHTPGANLQPIPGQDREPRMGNLEFENESDVPTGEQSSHELALESSAPGAHNEQISSVTQPGEPRGPDPFPEGVQHLGDAPQQGDPTETRVEGEHFGEGVERLPGEHHD
jgi:hypothetical protein